MRAGELAARTAGLPSIPQQDVVRSATGTDGVADEEPGAGPLSAATDRRTSAAGSSRATTRALRDSTGASIRKRASAALAALAQLLRLVSTVISDRGHRHARLHPDVVAGGVEERLGLREHDGRRAHVVVRRVHAGRDDALVAEGDGGLPQLLDGP